MKSTRDKKNAKKTEKIEKTKNEGAPTPEQSSYEQDYGHWGGKPPWHWAVSRRHPR